MKKQILLVFLFLGIISFYSYAEGSDDEKSKAVIAGRIVDGEDLPLPGATVFIKSVNKGAISDVNGYSLLKISDFSNRSPQLLQNSGSNITITV